MYNFFLLTLNERRPPNQEKKNNKKLLHLTLDIYVLKGFISLHNDDVNSEKEDI